MGRGGPRNPQDAERLVLEDLLALCVSALDRIRCAESRIGYRALTEYDRDNLVEVKRARRDLEQLKRDLCQFHPNRLESE